MGNKLKKNYGEHQKSNAPHGYVAELLDNPEDVVSANGTTGLIPVPPENEAEAEAYSDLCAVPQQVDKANLRKKDLP